MSNRASVSSGSDHSSTRGKHGKFRAASDEIERLVSARHHDPFAVLGRREWTQDGKTCANLMAYHPQDEKCFVRLLGDCIEQMEPLDQPGLFYWEGEAERLPFHPATSATADAPIWRVEPYSFFPVLNEHDLAALGHSDCHQAHNLLGSHQCEHEGVPGTRFAVWAPNAERVSVVGSFNQWDGREHPMRSRGSSGVWELFIPGLQSGEFYKYEVRNRQTGDLLLKSDPYGFYQEVRPNNASVVWHRQPYAWNDGFWMERRKHHQWLSRPISVYEVHLGSSHKPF